MKTWMSTLSKSMVTYRAPLAASPAAVRLAGCSGLEDRASVEGEESGVAAICAPGAAAGSAGKCFAPAGSLLGRPGISGAFRLPFRPLGAFR